MLFVLERTKKKFNSWFLCCVSRTKPSSFLLCFSCPLATASSREPRSLSCSCRCVTSSPGCFCLLAAVDEKKKTQPSCCRKETALNTQTFVCCRPRKKERNSPCCLVLAAGYRDPEKTKRNPELVLLSAAVVTTGEEKKQVKDQTALVFLFFSCSLWYQLLGSGHTQFTPNTKNNKI